MTRRELLALACLGVPAACRASGGKEEALAPRGHPDGTIGREAAEGRLLARPGRPAEEIRPGLHELGLGGARDGRLYVPRGYRPDRPAPLAVMLHGAGGAAMQAVGPLRGPADGAGLILLATDSRGQSWDVVEGGYGPDVAFLDRALELTFARCAVDPARLAIGGFSDGASYALSLGITNGDLFSHVIAFSPGFLMPKGQKGKPAIYVSHGQRDEILPIDATSRRLVPRLRSAGYEVLYREFDGPHSVPESLAREALEWLTG